MPSSYTQGWDQLPHCGPAAVEEAYADDSDYTIVYPVFLRKRLKDSEVKYDDSMMYIAGSVEKAKEWCQRNTDLETKNDPEHWWWFAVTQEAVDGDYSGIKGLMCLLDWDGKEISMQPLDGYKKAEEKENEDGN